MGDPWGGLNEWGFSSVPNKKVTLNLPPPRNGLLTEKGLTVRGGVGRGQHK